jgi:hypothetical protein
LRPDLEPDWPPFAEETEAPLRHVVDPLHRGQIRSPAHALLKSVLQLRQARTTATAARPVEWVCASSGTVGTASLWRLIVQFLNAAGMPGPEIGPRIAPVQFQAVALSISSLGRARLSETPFDPLFVQYIKRDDKYVDRKLRPPFISRQRRPVLAGPSPRHIARESAS